MNSQFRGNNRGQRAALRGSSSTISRGASAARGGNNRGRGRGNIVTGPRAHDVNFGAETLRRWGSFRRKRALNVSGVVLVLCTADQSVDDLLERFRAHKCCQINSNEKEQGEDGCSDELDTDGMVTRTLRFVTRHNESIVRQSCQQHVLHWIAKGRAKKMRERDHLDREQCRLRAEEELCLSKRGHVLAGMAERLARSRNRMNNLDWWMRRSNECGTELMDEDILCASEEEVERVDVVFTTVSCFASDPFVDLLCDKCDILLTLVDDAHTLRYSDMLAALASRRNVHKLCMFYDRSAPQPELARLVDLHKPTDTDVNTPFSFIRKRFGNVPAHRLGIDDEFHKKSDSPKARIDRLFDCECPTNFGIPEAFLIVDIGKRSQRDVVRAIFQSKFGKPLALITWDSNQKTEMAAVLKEVQTNCHPPAPPSRTNSPSQPQSDMEVCTPLRCAGKKWHTVVACWPTRWPRGNGASRNDLRLKPSSLYAALSSARHTILMLYSRNLPQPKSDQNDAINPWRRVKSGAINVAPDLGDISVMNRADEAKRFAENILQALRV